jgi:hypothetical protein
MLYTVLKIRQIGNYYQSIRDSADPALLIQKNVRIYQVALASFLINYKIRRDFSVYLPRC